jgi:transcriptional regulator of arginine metabolism
VARRACIARLLAERDVHSQEELRALLAREGHDVTQATVSRDLDDLGALRLPDPTGRVTYVLPESGDPASLPRITRTALELISSVASSGNIVVLRTPPGGAQLVASALDRAGWDAVLGTVAGDDTVLIVTADADGGSAVAEHLATVLPFGERRTTSRKAR